MTINLIGRRFGRQVVLGRNPNGAFAVRCNCGYVRPVQARDLISGHSRCCGRCNHGSPAIVSLVGQILCFVANEFEFEPAAMTCSSRAQPLVQYRQLAMWLARRETRASLPVIGRVFGGRDHTTVLHAIKITEKRIREDHFWRSLVDEVGAKMLKQPWLAAWREAA